MNTDESLDLLDLDDGASMDTLPDAVPFANPRPKKPWLLLTVGLVVIVLATYVIIRTVSGTSSSSAIEVDLDAPAIVVDGAPANDMNIMPPPAPKPVVPPQPVVQPQPMPQPAPVAQPKPAEAVGAPVRVVEDRKEVTFNPTAKPVAKPQPKPAAKPQPKPAAKPVATKSVYDWYVQLGSYSTRALAESAQRQMRNSHQSLFAGQQFVILAAQLKNGTTTYRLRVGFKTSADANGFCRNAKSDGLDCYVTK